MTNDREAARIVRAWLAKGVTVLPDRVLDDVLDQVPSIRQSGRHQLPTAARAWRGGSFLALTAAAVVVAGFVAVRVLGPGDSAFSGAHPSPDGSASRVISTSPSAIEQPVPEGTPRMVPPVGPIAGTYRVDNVEGSGIQVTFTVPAGWTSCCGGWVEKHGTDPPDGMAFEPWIVRNVYSNPCDRSTGATHIGPRVTDLIAAVRAQPDRRPSVPATTSVSGYAGQEIEWSVPSDASFGDCSGSTFVSWYGGDVASAERYHQGPNQVDHLWALDVDGTTLTLMTSYFPGTTSADRAELDGLIGSILIEPVPAPSSPSPSAADLPGSSP